MLGVFLALRSICFHITVAGLWGNTQNVCALPDRSSPRTPTSSAPTCCQTFYPSEYRVLNSRYPGWGNGTGSSQSPLHVRTDYFMLLRQQDDTFQVATQVQWTNLRAQVPLNTTCMLQLQLPTDDLQVVTGSRPIFNAYKVEREAGVPAAWDTYEAKESTELHPPIFGQVNGTPEAQSRQRSLNQGIYDVGATDCNDTMTWQMGMAFNGGDEVNYWSFLSVSPPASNIQGFRLLAGC